jgi:hypothetical protein
MVERNSQLYAALYAGFGVQSPYLSILLDNRHLSQVLGRDPHAGDLYVFRGARGDLIKLVWHDGIGMSLYAKRLERSEQGMNSFLFMIAAAVMSTGFEVSFQPGSQDGAGP